MKKKLLLLLALAGSILCALVGLTGCDLGGNSGDVGNSGDSGNNSTVNPSATHKHSMEWVFSERPTCVTAGNVEYYYCSKCDKKFSDKAGTVEVEDVTVPATGKHYWDGNVCTVCKLKKIFDYQLWADVKFF